ncbi:transcriptional regulator [Acinetobacter sp. KAM398]|uniref:helix-turn-helix domain-containing protein n=1 Tax=Acinetobacter TaxID=469 RepID=UPI000B3ECBB6|nr:MULTISPECIES: helix-turn-helix transcriptional regulator [Acinetobacter]MBT0888542.1 helix-turn-helix domain-containing protein [Acinetobacter towneri]MDV2456566.1 helix-turn-helix transcriptional regulator [Acinetobacter towneri]NWJ93946.1 helix-turn-helix transcriptional regulator [Acinetobacter sp. Swhac1]OUY11643.1 transcriptional regulator [Acinetobacter indicus]UIZ58186.1 helix-turn-helix domain-containing protein [Acinetobacter sp. SCLZS86]
MSELSVAIGQLIRNRRTQQKLTQESLALQCGIDRSYMGRIERGEVNLTVEKIYEIAFVLKISAKDLGCVDTFSLKK